MSTLLCCWRFLFILLTLAAPPVLAGVGQGQVEMLRYDPAGRQVLLSGWAAPEAANVFTAKMVVVVDGQRIYQGRFRRAERADLVARTGRADWLWSGWSVEVPLPGGIAPGPHAVAVEALLTDGGRLELEPAPQAAVLQVTGRSGPSRTAVAVAGLAVALPLLLLLFGERLAGRCGGRVTAPALFAGAVGLAFLLLVAVGVTGSSLRLALDGSPVVRDDGIPWFGQAREIRSDEWRILTQLAIGQANHAPPFPVINRNVGIDGQNMLVVGMSGVPVAHVSALAKPATWGFFLFDLRRALAWHWWFPFFACFGALAVLLRRLFQVDWRIAATLAATVSAAPYSVGFSGHPAYLVSFAALGLVAAEAGLRTRRPMAALVLGGLLGLASAGFVLVLYPPWQIGLAYLLGPMAAAAVVARRRQLVFGRAQVLGLAAAALVGAGLLGSWWLDAREAVEVIAGTVYPGQRAASVGGDIDPWFLVKGLMSPVTMYSSSTLMDPSDAASFVVLLVPLAVAFVAIAAADRRIEPVALLLLLFAAAALAYMYLGFAPALARFTLWGRMTSYRLDLALCLAQTLLLAWLASPGRLAQLAARPWRMPLAAATAALVALLALALFGLLPTAIATVLSPAFVLLSCAALGAISYLLVGGRPAAAIGIYAVWTVATALPFNPVSQAPKSVAAATGWQELVASAGRDADQRRVAIVDEHGWTVTSVAVGEPTVNTVMYYPQTSLWRALDPSGEHRTLYNRYQHLLLQTAALPPGPAYRIESQRLDAVRVVLDPGRFDFRLLGAAWVLTGEGTAAAMAGNPSVVRMAGRDGWVMFRVPRGGA